MTSSRGYKFVTAEMQSKKDHSCVWKLGEWKKWDGPLKMCETGFHDSPTPLKSLNYIYGDRWFITETRGVHIEDTGKSVHSEMRLVEEIPVKKVCIRFAIACARRSLSNFEKEYPEDDRPRKAIEAVEAYLKDPSEENWSVASAAWFAAKSAAESAAWFTASSAAESAAWFAAKSAAESAELKWQEKKLLSIIEESLRNHE